MLGETSIRDRRNLYDESGSFFIAYLATLQLYKHFPMTETSITFWMQSGWMTPRWVIAPRVSFSENQDVILKRSGLGAR
jgi:hypothetical protein